MTLWILFIALFGVGYVLAKGMARIEERLRAIEGRLPDAAPSGWGDWET